MVFSARHYRTSQAPRSILPLLSRAPLASPAVVVVCGTVEVQDDDAATTIVLDGRLGLVTAGGNGSSGKFSVHDDGGQERARIAGSLGTYFVSNGLGQDLIEIGGLEGALVVRQALGTEFPEVLTFKQDTAALTVGAESAAGTIVGRDHHGHDTITLASAAAAVTVRADIGGTLGDVLALDGNAGTLAIGPQAAKARCVSAMAWDSMPWC